MGRSIGGWFVANCYNRFKLLRTSRCKFILICGYLLSAFVFYDRYNAEVALSRSFTRASDKEATKKGKKSRPKPCTSKTAKLSSTSSSSEEPSTTEGSTSGDEEQKPPLEQLLAAPKKPKADPPLAVVKDIEELPVLRLFAHHLRLFEGGARKERIGTDHVRRVGRLLYEVDDAPKSVKKLWQNLPMNKIRNNFFAGNDLLGKDRRKPQTLKTYIVSYRMFLRFVLSRQEDVRQLMEFGDEDMRQVQSGLGRLETWPKAYSDAFNLRKAEVRRRDEGERLSRDDFRSFVNSDKAMEIISDYQNLRENPTRAVDLNRFAELRDYLLLRVITASGQRCGAAGNLTIEEFEQGVQHTPELFVTKTLRHKTAAGGQAKLMWNVQLKEMATTYKEQLRPLFANERSVIPGSAGIPEKPAFFISAAGQPMNESMISKRIVAMGKKLNPELPRNLRGSRLRKGIITLQRSEETSTVSAQTLAKQMSHSVSTAQKYYNIEEQARSDIRVASFLGSLVEKVADEKHTRVSEEVEGEEEKEKLNTYPIKLVREAEVQTVVVAGVKTNPDAPKKPSCQEMTLKVPLLQNNKKPFTLLKEEKMELIRLFQDIIKVGRVPAKFIYNQRKMHNTILKRVRYENAVAYLTKK